MGRFSPTVRPEPILYGDIISGALNTYQRAAKQRQESEYERALLDIKRQDLEREQANDRNAWNVTKVKEGLGYIAPLKTTEGGLSRPVNADAQGFQRAPMVGEEAGNAVELTKTGPSYAELLEDRRAGNELQQIRARGDEERRTLDARPSKPLGTWSKSVDPSGRVNYFNPETGETKATGLRERVPSDGPKTEPGWSVMQTDQGPIRVNARTGETAPLEGVGAKTPAGIQKELGSLEALEADLVAAAQAVKSSPKAFSGSRVAFKAINAKSPVLGSMARTLFENSSDPLESQARIMVGGVSNEALHKKYGSALSLNEVARSELDTPNVDGDNAEQISRKIDAMLANVRRRRSALSGGKPQAVQETAPPKAGRSIQDAIRELRGGKP